MCLKHRRAANRKPLSSTVDLFLAKTSERTKIPYMKPLYWKCIWSMIRRPGERRIERAAAWEGRLRAAGED
jgi:hypothetical protein